MNHQNHRDLPEHKAGQAVAAALHQPLPLKQIQLPRVARIASLEEKP
ncbi:MAG TPA: hypothetical protein VEJ47_05470 [Candidatus Eremiobacteraceae bacterium]|nr:hypothetical protein [Candidatus Eremiobacteraceae bacterium]